LLSIKTVEEANNRDILLDKAPWWDSVFADFSALYLLETRQSRENMSTKRRARMESRKPEGDLGSPIQASGRARIVTDIDTSGMYQRSRL
jgi:hypothetical protein